MKLSKSKILLLSIMVGVLALGALAFTPFTALTQTDPDDDDGETAPYPGDHFQALADALDVSVEDLQSAYEAAFRQALEQSVNDALEQGLITQERADAILDGEEHMGRGKGFRMGMGISPGGNLDELVAGQLGISVEEFQAAQSELHTAMIEQAVAEGEMTQTAADLSLARQAVRGYMEDAWTTAYQGAVQSALDAGAIDQAQADLLLDNIGSGFPGGFGRMPMGGRGGHMHR